MILDSMKKAMEFKNGFKNEFHLLAYSDQCLVN